MGRTLHYALYDDPKTCRAARAELRVALELLIYRFTWTCEQPSLHWLDEGERLDWSTDNEGQEAPIADCYVKVAGDEWNAVLVTRFVAWLSRRLPTAQGERMRTLQFPRGWQYPFPHAELPMHRAEAHAEAARPARPLRNAA